MIYSGAYGWEAKKPVNEGIQADLSVGFDGAVTLRMIRYTDPESGVDDGFLTSVMDLEPGLKKVEQKRKEQLVQRNTRARAQGRKVAALQRFLPVAVQLTAQFIRSLRNAILAGMRWARAMELLRATTESYL